MLKMGIALVILTWNCADVLRTAIDSVEKVVDEVVAVDSSSTDGTLDILREYGEKYKYAVEVYTKALKGSWSGLRNFGIEKSTNEWILILDSDEYLTGETIEMIPELVRSSEADCYIFRRLNYLDGVLQEAKDYHFRLFKRHCRYEGVIHEQLVGFNKSKVIEGAVVMHKKTRVRQKEQDERYLEFNRRKEGKE